MANFHIRINNGGKGYGKAHVEYICREGSYKLRKNEEILIKEHFNMPEWAENNPIEFWKQADLNERENGRSYKGIVISLPNELSAEEQINLTRDFIKKEIGDSYVCSYAIHIKKAEFEAEVKQPHAHIMMSERKLDGIERTAAQFFKRANAKKPELGGAKKDRSWNEIGKVYNLRQSWQDIQNDYYKKHNVNIQVDCRKLVTLKQEAIDSGDTAKASLYDREPVQYASKKQIQQYLRQLADGVAINQAKHSEAILMFATKAKKKLHEEKFLLDQNYKQNKKSTLEESIKYEYDASQILIEMKKINSAINTESSNIKIRIKDLERRVKVLDRITERDSIEKISINKISNNREKFLTKEFLILSQNRSYLEKKASALQEKIPSRFNFLAYQKVRDSINVLNDDIILLKQKERNNRDDYNKLISSVSAGELYKQKEKIKHTMIDSANKKREIITKQIEVCKAIIKDNNQINSRLDSLPLKLKLKKQKPKFIDGKEKIKIKEPLSKYNIISAIDKISRDEKVSTRVDWNINLNKNNQEYER